MLLLSLQCRSCGTTTAYCIVSHNNFIALLYAMLPQATAAAVAERQSSEIEQLKNALVRLETEKRDIMLEVSYSATCTCHFNQQHFTLSVHAWTRNQHAAYSILTYS
jgi:hypothetical protein